MATEKKTRAQLASQHKNLPPSGIDYLGEHKDFRETGSREALSFLNYHRRLALLMGEIEQKKNQLAEIQSSLLWRLGKALFYCERVIARWFRFKKEPEKEFLPEIAANTALGFSTENSNQIQVFLQEQGLSLEELTKSSPGFLFLAPFEGSGGGMHSIVQEVQAMRRLGFRAKIASPQGFRDHYLTRYPDSKQFLFYNNPHQLLESEFRVFIATYFVSMDLLERLWLQDPTIQCGYYVQDYEPWFFHGGTEWEQRAYRSYGRIPGMTHFAKTNFLCEILRERHGLECHLIQPSLDQTVFRPPGPDEKESPPIVLAMIRPKTPWRQPAKTLAVLKKLKIHFDQRIRVVTFGCDVDELAGVLPKEPFSFEHLGSLKSEEVAALFRKASVFLDLSTYQGFGRTGLEAMASGCVPVLPEKSGPSRYAVQRENALLINTGDEKAAFDAVAELINDIYFLNRLAKSGISTAAQFHPGVTALSQVLLFRPYMN